MMHTTRTGFSPGNITRESRDASIRPASTERDENGAVRLFVYWRERARVAALFAVFAIMISPLRAEEFGEYLHYRLGSKYKAGKDYDKAIDEFRKSLADYPENYNVYMHIAEIRMLQGKPRLAIADLKQALACNPGWGRAHNLLAQAYTRDNQLQKAIAEYQHYQQSCDPAERDSVQQVIDRLVANIGLGGMLRGDETGFPGGKGPPPKRDGPAVAAKPRAAIPIMPSDPGAAEAFKRAVAEYRSHRYDTALALLKKVIAAQPGFAGAYYYGGLVRYRMGHHALAKSNFEKGLGYFDPEYAGLLCMGKIYGMEQNYPEAVRALSRYCRLTSSGPGKKEAAELLSRYQASGGKEGGADTPGGMEAGDNGGAPSLEVPIDSLLAMVTVDTLSDAGRKLLAGIHEFQEDRFDQAIREFKKTLAVHPAGPAAVQCIYNSGICYFKLRLYKEAENQFQQILDRYPRHDLAAQAFFLKAMSFSERKETILAERLFREFLQSYRRHAWEDRAWEALGDIYVELDQPKKAIDAFLHVIATSSGHRLAKAYFTSGVAYLSLANSGRALACFDSAIRKGERSKAIARVPDSYYRAADEKYKNKEYKGALAYYVRVTRKYPAFAETPWGLFQIGNIHKNLRGYQEAIDAYKELIQRFPDDYWAGQARWKLDDTVWEHEYQTSIR